MLLNRRENLARRRITPGLIVEPTVYVCTQCNRTLPARLDGRNTCSRCTLQGEIVNTHLRQQNINNLVGPQAKPKKILAVAEFVREIPGWRGRHTALYKLNHPLNDYEYVVANSLREANLVSDTSLFGALQDGNTPDNIKLARIFSLSHTEILEKAGYNLMLSQSNPQARIDSWEVSGTHVNEHTGQVIYYEVTRYANDLWACSCPPFVSRQECQHVKKQKKKIIDFGCSVLNDTKLVETQERELRLED